MHKRNVPKFGCNIALMRGFNGSLVNNQLFVSMMTQEKCALNLNSLLFTYFFYAFLPSLPILREVGRLWPHRPIARFNPPKSGPQSRDLSFSKQILFINPLRFHHLFEKQTRHFYIFWVAVEQHLSTP